MARLYPQMTLERDLQVLFRQICHIVPTQPYETAEGEQVMMQPSVVEGGKDDTFERHHVQPYCIGAVPFLYAKEQLEVRDEGGGKLFQGDVLHLVACLEKF